MWKVKNKRPEDGNTPEEFYDEYEAEKYKKTKSMKRVQQKIVLKLVEYLDIDLEKKKVLDIGCGPGFTMEILKELGSDVFGIDVSKNMLMNSDFKGRIILSDARNMALKDNSFDYLFSVSAIQWFTKDVESVKKFSEECFRVLKPSGIFAFQFYPKTEEEAKKVFKVFSKKFHTELVIENEKSKKRFVFLFGKKP